MTVHRHANGEPSWEVSDNCDGDVAVSYTYSDVAVADCSDGDGADEEGYTTDPDVHGNGRRQLRQFHHMSCDQTITFTDEEARCSTATRWAIRLPSAAVICPIRMTRHPAASRQDNCDSELDHEISMAFLTSGSCPGTYVRIWKAYDDCGNRSGECNPVCCHRRYSGTRVRLLPGGHHGLPR